MPIGKDVGMSNDVDEMLELPRAYTQRSFGDQCCMTNSKVLHTLVTNYHKNSTLMLTHEFGSNTNYTNRLESNVTVRASQFLT